MFSTVEVVYTRRRVEIRDSIDLLAWNSRAKLRPKGAPIGESTAHQEEGPAIIFFSKSLNSTLVFRHFTSRFFRPFCDTALMTFGYNRLDVLSIIHLPVTPVGTLETISISS